MTNVSSETIHLLERIQKQSQHHHTRQRAQCILLSHRGYAVPDLMRIFQVHQITIYRWFDAWEARRFVGVYDRPGKGATPKLTPAQATQVNAWGKAFPRQLATIVALVKQTFGISVSKKTLTRVLTRLQMTWRRVRRRGKGQPDADE